MTCASGPIDAIGISRPEYWSGYKRDEKRNHHCSYLGADKNRNQHSNAGRGNHIELACTEEQEDAALEGSAEYIGLAEMMVADET